MRRAPYFFSAGPARPGGADLACFALLTQVGKSDDHQLVSPADMPTKVT